MVATANEKVLINEDDTVRVMIVDDSLVIRGAISRIFKKHPEISVVATCSDGQKAVDRLRRGGIDVVVLDVEMPNMDGLTALPELLKVDPTLVVIMASTLTTRNAGISLKCLQLGASDYVPKPTSSDSLFDAEDFERELVEKVIALSAPVMAARMRKKAETTVSAPKQPALVKKTILPVENRFRAPSNNKPKVLAVGCSTGGPVALMQFFAQLPTSMNLPIVVTQHMPKPFTRLLAEHLSRDTEWNCREAEEDDALETGTVLIAPGDYHMTVKGSRLAPKVSLNQDEKENFCRPAVDPMLRSVVKMYGSDVLCVILTGMGSDGLKGCELVVEKGGNVLAQDEESSVVWGMPGAVAQAGLCVGVMPIPEIVRKTVWFANR